MPLLPMPRSRPSHPHQPNRLPALRRLLAMADELGGIQRIVLRFFGHYEAFTPVGLFSWPDLFARC